MSFKKSTKEELDARTCLTPKFRAAFANIAQPKAFGNNEPKYSVTMLFDKKEDLKELKRAYKNAAIEMFGKDEKKWANKRGEWGNPFHDGEEKEDLQGFKGKIFVNASSKKQPGVVDKDREDLIDLSEFYSGCYARAKLIAFPYDHQGNRGVSFSLISLQKLGEGEKFGGSNPKKDFDDDYEDTDGSEDESAYESDDISDDDL